MNVIGQYFQRVYVFIIVGREIGKKYKAKPKKKINPVSEKRRSELNEYRKIHAVFLKEHSTCEVKRIGCLYDRTIQVHHKAGRIGDLLCDATKFLAVCEHCHQWIEQHPLEAYENGWSLSRLEKGDEGD
jgi:hypothetical protein